MVMVRRVVGLLLLLLLLVLALLLGNGSRGGRGRAVLLRRRRAPLPSSRSSECLPDGGHRVRYAPIVVLKVPVRLAERLRLHGLREARGRDVTRHARATINRATTSAAGDAVLPVGPLR